MKSARIALVFLLLVASAARADDFVNPKANIPPKGAPMRRDAGSGMGGSPAPMPGTALRRSEIKRQPSPPPLIGSITFSPFAIRDSGSDWQTTIIDVEKLIDFTNTTLGQRYRYVDTDFSKFSFDPTDLPILYFTGWKALPAFDDKTIANLRNYLMSGGTWIVHSSCGRPEFNATFAREIRRIFPDRELAPIPTDHPIFSSFYDITSMRMREGTGPWKEIPPLLETVNIGTRAAVIFSPIDLSCGWDADAHPIPGGILYNQADALKLGGNIVTYALAEYQYGRFFPHAKVYIQAADKTRDQLVLAQLVHNGDWDATPHGLPNLLKRIDTTTTLHIQFKRVAVDPATSSLFEYPVLYMCGQRDFSFSDDVRAKLKQFFDRGGTLVADDVIGSSEFDRAFRREMKAIFPDKPLAPLPADHPIFSYVFDERTARLAPLARQLFGDSIPPRLEAINVDGQLPVIYSPLSMSAGWEELPRAYDKGYADDDALKLGINVFMYTQAH